MRAAYFAVALLLLGTLAQAEEAKAVPKTITATGELQRVMAIGGETTGWAVALTEPIQLESGPVTRLEVDPGRTSLGSLENRRVRLSGKLDQRRGVERGPYWVLLVEKAEAVPEGKE